MRSRCLRFVQCTPDDAGEVLVDFENGAARPGEIKYEESNTWGKILQAQ